MEFYLDRLLLEQNRSISIQHPSKVEWSDARLFLAFYLETAASEGSLERRHHLSSWLISVISMPGMTMNLQESISRGSSSSGSWQVTRQYWQSWFQQKRP